MLTEIEQNEAIRIYQNRCSERFLSEFHYLANYLDPRYIGKVFRHDESKIFRISETLTNYATNLNIIFDETSKENLANTLADYINTEGYFTSPLLPRSKPIPFWKFIKQFDSSKGLANLAIRLLSIPASSASVEKSFSSQGRLHSKDRNRLGESKVEKIMRIQYALKSEVGKNSKNEDKYSHDHECANERFDIDSLKVLEAF